MRVNQIIIRHNIGNSIGLVEEELEECNSIIISLGAVHGGDDGIAGEDSGASVGEDGVASNGGGGVEVSGSDKGLDTVVEVESWAH